MENENPTNEIEKTLPAQSAERVALFENYLNEERVCITCIYGPFRSGKSTLVQNLIESVENPIVLDEDMLKHYVFDQKSYGDTYVALMGRLAHYFAAQGHNVIVDSVFGSMIYDNLKKTLADAAALRARRIDGRINDNSVDIVLRKIKVDEVATFAQ